MKSTYQLDTLPTSGVIVTLEGSLTRLLFDFTTHPAPSGEGEAAPENLYDCQSVDVNGRSYGDIVGAIVNDRYSADSVQAIIANHELAKDAESGLSDEKRAEYLADYLAFQAWRAHAKEVAHIALEEIAAL